MVQAAGSPPRSSRRLLSLALGTAFAAVLLSVAATAWWFWPPRPPELEAGWNAAVILLAGDGVPGWRDGPAHRARFEDPFGIAAAPDGSIYVSDAGESHRIRRISPEGMVTTVAGGGRGFVDGAGAAARFDTPSGLALDAAGTLYIADTGNNAIRRLAPDGTVTTLAGDGRAGFRDGAAHEARFNGPLGLALGPGGELVVADTYNDRIRVVSPGGRVTTLAGGALPGYADGPGSLALFDTPAGVAVNDAGAVLVADTGNDLVRRIDPGGFVSTRPTAAEGLLRPIALASGPDGVLYVTDDRGRVLELSGDDGARTLAGAMPGFRDGAGASARLRRPSGVALSGRARLVVADSGNAVVRLLGAPSRLDLRPPAPTTVVPAFDVSQFARTPLLWPLSPMEGPHEVAGTLGESRGSEAERFHSGIDIRGDHGAPVRAVRPGVVAAPVSTGAFGTLNEWIRIGDVTYVHLRAGRSRSGEPMDPARFVAAYDEEGRVAGIRVKRGARFEAGDIVGSVNPFNHVHLNVGWPGEEHNPLHFGLVGFEDRVPPTIARGGIRLFDESGAPLRQRANGRTLVRGRVQIVVDAWDQANGNRRHRRLGLYALGYQVLRADGTPAAGFDSVRETIRFDRLADADAARLVFATGSGIPYYGRRTTRFLYVVTNTFRDGVAQAGFLDTATLEPGPYVLRIHAADIRGNLAARGRDLAIQVEADRAGT